VTPVIAFPANIPVDDSPPLVAGRHWVRYGYAGNVGLFGSAERAIYRRGQRVVCRTDRGLEIGEVLSRAEEAAVLGDGDSDGVRVPPRSDGTTLRAVTVEDELLLSRLERRRDEAFAACAERLAERGIDAVLVDVEHLFDGQTLYFYFLGEVTPAMADVAAELTEVYEAKARFRQFTDVLEAGCGPGCGTEDAENGCGSACSTCSVLDACKRK
jgi:cell fate regulator YaaT (PSP1 superfamily)